MLHARHRGIPIATVVTLAILSSQMPGWGVVPGALPPVEPHAGARIESLAAHLGPLQKQSSGSDQEGARLFRVHCAVCHGATGRGDGPMAGELRQAPSDLTAFTERNRGVFPTDRVFRIIDGREVRAHGSREMPIWGDAFRSQPDGLTADQVKDRIDAIVAYLRAIQQRDANLLPTP